MKKILIVSHAMELGGAERALIGLLDAVDYSRVSVDLFLERHSGELLGAIPKQVRLLPENKAYASMAVPAAEVLKNRKFGVALGRFYAKIKAKSFNKKSGYKNGFDVVINYSGKYTAPFMPMISDEEYDLVVSFLTPHYYALKKAHGKVKAAWIHTDYSAVEIDRDAELKMWSGFDRIISISDAVTKSFVKTFPELRDKITVIENMHPPGYIKEKSEEFDPESEMPHDGSIALLSIGRFCTAKNFDNVPFICKNLVEKHGLNVKWYIIGYGTDEKLIKDNIAAAGMQGRVIILGKKVNPYPYMKRCDFYIQPSRFEGNAVTVNEALILSKLVAITDYPTSSSQIKNGVNGVITGSGNEECAQGIADFIKDSRLQSEIMRNIQNSDFSNSGEAEKFYGLLENLK